MEFLLPPGAGRKVDFPLLYEKSDPLAAGQSVAQGRVAELPSDLSPFSNGRTELCAVNWGRRRRCGHARTEFAGNVASRMGWSPETPR